MNTEELKHLLKEVSAPISSIELKIGIPKNVLQQSLKGKRSLPKEWVIKLKAFVESKQYIGLKRKSRKKTEIPKKASEKKVNDASKSTGSDFTNERWKKKMGIK